MHHYINPIALLNFTAESDIGLDSYTIRKAKRSLIADIELSDTNAINFNGVELTKSDCLRVIDELDDKDKKDFHYFIFEHKPLLNFLTNGDLTFFTNYKIESIYKLPEFINFISPYSVRAGIPEILKNTIIKNEY